MQSAGGSLHRAETTQLCTTFTLFSDKEQEAESLPGGECRAARSRGCILTSLQQDPGRPEAVRASGSWLLAPRSLRRPPLPLGRPPTLESKSWPLRQLPGLRLRVLDAVCCRTGPSRPQHRTLYSDLLQTPRRQSSAPPNQDLGPRVLLFHLSGAERVSRRAGVGVQCHTQGQAASTSNIPPINFLRRMTTGTV